MFKSIQKFFLNMTPLKKVNDYFDGKKAIFVSLGTALVGTGTIAANLAASENRLHYLMQLATTQEFLAASGGWAALFLAIKGEKIRLGIETQIHGEGGDPNRQGTPANIEKTEKEDAKK